MGRDVFSVLKKILFIDQRSILNGEGNNDDRTDSLFHFTTRDRLGDYRHVGADLFLKNTSTGRAGILAGLIGFIVSAVAVLTGTGELRYELMLPLGILGGLFSATIAMYSVVLCRKPARN